MDLRLQELIDKGETGALTPQEEMEMEQLATIQAIKNLKKDNDKQNRQRINTKKLRKAK